MKNNKKGFTLVELLAVIVILGVLMVIAVPAVTNIQKTSKQKALKDGALMFLKAVETYNAMDTGTLADYYEGKLVSAAADCDAVADGNCAYYLYTPYAPAVTDPVTGAVITPAVAEEHSFTYVLEGYGVTYKASTLKALKSKIQSADASIYKKDSMVTPS